MKNNIKLVILASVGMLFSCQKDNIEVVKNLDKSWDIDTKIKEADIRNRLGYDPRFNYVLIENTELNLPMYTLGDLPISGENKDKVEVKILKPLEKDLKVTLEYDAELFESIKKDYLGYDLGAEDLIPLTEKTKVIPKGETSVKFDVSMPNNPSFKGKQLVPFKLKIEDESVRLLDNKEKVLFKVYDQEISFSYPTRVVKNLILGNDMYSTDIQISSSISRILSDQLTLSLQKSSLDVPNMAPQNAEGTLPTDIDFAAKDQIRFKWGLNTADLEQGQTYQFPLEVVAKIGDKSYTLPDTILVVLDTNFSEDDNLYLGQNPIGFPISKVGMTANGAEYYSPALIDNSLRSIAFTIPRNVVRINFGETKIVSSIRISRAFKQTRSNRLFTYIEVYARKEYGDLVSITES